MPKRESTSSNRSELDNDDALLDYANWDETSAEDVMPRPSGMSVLSLRLPREEFQLLKREADRRHVSMSEMTRAALRLYVAPRATGSLSAAALHHLQVSSYTSTWTGGMGNAAHIEGLVVSVGNVIPPYGKYESPDYERDVL